MEITKDLLIHIFHNSMVNILLGDGARRDKDGYYWITGRVDDVIIVSGHNLGTAEIESAFVAHPKVAEAAVVGYPHDIKGKRSVLLCYFKRW
jgi:acetyl-CoA synthetase